MTAFTTPLSSLSHDMLGDLVKVYTQLREHAAVETAWTVTMSYARHRMSQIGKLREGVWYAQAFGAAAWEPRWSRATCYPRRLPGATTVTVCSSRSAASLPKRLTGTTSSKMP